MTKSELRKIYLTRRKEFSPAEIKHKSSLIARRFFENFDLSAVEFLHCFVAVEKLSEVDTNLIFQKIWRCFPHVETVVPRVNYRTGELEHLKFTPASKVVKSNWGIDEPEGNEFVESEKIDLVLVPLLCFDQNGFRVGYGKGFYDKFLKNCRVDCLKIGLSYFEPITKIEDVSEFDVRLDFCVMPERVVNCE